MIQEAKDGTRLRVAVLNRDFLSTGGGAERYSIALVEQLAHRHELHVFAQNIDHHCAGVTYHKVWQPLRRPRWINQLCFAALTWWQTRRGFDMVHSHENTWHGEVQTVHVLPVKYTLFHGRDGLKRALRWLKVLTSPRLLAYLWLERCRYSNSKKHCIVVTSTSLQDIMARTYPAVVDCLAVLTPGVGNAPGLASAASKQAARAHLGLPPVGTGVLFIANDYQKKGLGTLLDAVPQMPDDVFLVVVGNAAHIPPFSARVKAMGLEARVFFLGALKDVTPAYCAADCLVHPTLEDTFAMVVLEAQAHGLPVVVSGVAYCGISALLEHDVTALILANPRDSAALADAVNRLLQNPTLAQHVSTQGLAFARNHLWSQKALEQEQIYRSLR